MKKTIWIFGPMMLLLFSGCANRYPDVDGDKYATLQVVTKGSDFSYWDQGLKVAIEDYTKGCKDMENLGAMAVAGGDTSDIVKIPANKPLLFRISYNANSGPNLNIDELDFVLIPHRGTHYVVEYERKEVDGKSEGQYSVFIKEGKKRYRIPEKSIRAWAPRECY